MIVTEAALQWALKPTTAVTNEEVECRLQEELQRLGSKESVRQICEAALLMPVRGYYIAESADGSQHPVGLPLRERVIAQRILEQL